MEKISRVVVLLLFTLFLTAPLFGDNGEESSAGVPEVSTEPEVLMETLKPEEAVTQEGADVERNVDVAETESGEGVITGKVVSLDAVTGAITVKTEDGTDKTFSVIEGETIIWKGIDDIKLSDISNGEEAEVGYYTDETGKLIASWVDVIVEEEAVPAAPEAVSEEPQNE